MGHGSDIDFGHEIAGEVGLEIAEGGLGEEVAIAGAPPGLSDEVDGIAIGELFDEILLVEPGSFFFAEDLNPIHVAFIGGLALDFEVALEAAEEGAVSAGAGESAEPFPGGGEG